MSSCLACLEAELFEATRSEDAVARFNAKYHVKGFDNDVGNIFRIYWLPDLVQAIEKMIPARKMFPTSIRENSFGNLIKASSVLLS